MKINFQDLDSRLFRVINQEWANAVLDLILPFVRQAYFWIPVYVFILSLMLLQYGRKAVPWLLALIFVFAYTDLIAASLLKPLIARIRPCNDLESMRLLVNCGGGYSMPSAHASNHFGLSYFILFTLRDCLPKYAKTLLVLWAVAVAYAQVYVGVHYPLDVFVGALIGILVAWAVSHFYIKKT